MGRSRVFFGHGRGLCVPRSVAERDNKQKGTAGRQQVCVGGRTLRDTNSSSGRFDEVWASQFPNDPRNLYPSPTGPATSHPQQLESLLLAILL